jgi:hypothetical protein
MDEYKALQLVSPAARANWREFAFNLMNSLNPYTGLRWKDDPAIAWIVPLNENTMGSATQNLPAASRALFDQAWQSAGNTGAWNFQTDAGARFGASLHAQAYAWMKQELRGMGVKALLSDLNGWWDQKVFSGNRADLDYVDNHNYWDHPIFLSQPWNLPSRGSNDGGMAVKDLGGAGLQAIALTRTQGKPFTVSEFQFTAPNRYRAEGGLLMGSIAARQDWDALFRFAWSHNSESIIAPARFDFFDLQSDPVGIATERAIVALFLRGHMSPALEAGVLRVNPSSPGAAGRYSASMMNQLLTRRLFSSPASGGDGNLAVPGGPHPAEINPAAGLLTVNTPQTQGVFGPAGTTADLGALDVVLSGSRQAVWATSLDDRPLTNSARILLTQITDVQNSGIRYSGPDRQIVESWGTLPHLVRAGSAEATLTCVNPSRLKVYRLDMAGNRIAELPVVRTATTISFTLQTVSPLGNTLYHEVASDTVDNVRFVAPPGGRDPW